MKFSFRYLSLVVVLFAACKRTEIISPEAAYSPDSFARLSVSCQGPYGAYWNNAKKTLELRIVSLRPGNSAVLFNQQLSIQGSDIDWDARWVSPEECVVDIFDYGKGVNRDGHQISAPSNHLATITLRLNKSTGLYEQAHN